jgi:hypothetical protein
LNLIIGLPMLAGAIGTELTVNRRNKSRTCLPWSGRATGTVAKRGGDMESGNRLLKPPHVDQRDTEAGFVVSA